MVISSLDDTKRFLDVFRHLKTAKARGHVLFDVIPLFAKKNDLRALAESVSKVCMFLCFDCRISTW